MNTKKARLRARIQGKGKKVKKNSYGYGCDQQRRSCEKKITVPNVVNRSEAEAERMLTGCRSEK